MGKARNNIEKLNDIVSGNGNHLQMHNGAGGKWNWKVNASTGQFSLVRAGGTGLLALETAYLGNYANDGAAAAGGVAVGESCTATDRF